MSEQVDHIKNLLEKYVSNRISDAEMRELFALLEDRRFDKDLEELVLRVMENAPATDTYKPEEWNPVVDDILKARRVIPMKRRPSVAGWWWAAAVVLLVLGAGLFYPSNYKTAGPAEAAVAPTPVVPGSEGAILTLADGSKVVLDSVGNGTVAVQNGAKAVVRNGQLIYDPTLEVDNQVYYNTLVTPRGRQYALVLPDGSKVWLNSGSSIRYPTVFNGKERLVEVTGETYFDVAKNPKMPFRVQVNGKTRVDVLGTAFNINAYSDEPVIRTTLVEGSVRVGTERKGRNSQVTLSPGQQAVSKPDVEGIDVLSDVNTFPVTAWKDGVFVFDGVSLEEAMRQLERWYDVRIVYAQSVPKLQLGGSIKRSLPFSDVLRFFGNVGLKYEVESNGKIVILP